MDFEKLDIELQEKIKECKNIDELRALAETEGLPLSDEELEGLAGGAKCSNYFLEAYAKRRV